MPHLLASLSKRIQPARRLALLAGLSGLCLLFSALAWQAALRPAQARLTHLSLPGLAHGPCPASGPAAQTGPALEFATEWVLQDDLVPVLRDFVQHGWETTTYMTTSIELVAKSPAVAHLGTMQLRMYRGASLAYTPDRATRVMATASIIICPP